MNTQKTKGDILAERIEKLVGLYIEKASWAETAFRDALADYRIKPSPVMVPLGPEDVPPGSYAKPIDAAMNP